MSECIICNRPLVYSAVTNKFVCPNSSCEPKIQSFGTLGIIEVCDNIDQRESLGYWLAETSTHVILAAYSDGDVPCAYLKDKYTFKKVTVS